MSKLKTKTIKDLIPIFGQNIEQEKVQTVNARDVWEFLEVTTRFNDWIKRYIKNYDFVEGQDYVCYSNLSNKGEEGRNKPVEYYVSLDMAKEFSMVQNNPKGKEARKYFLDCEKIAKEAIAAGFRKKDRQLTLEHKQLREDGKLDRRAGTDAYKRFVDYAVSRGSSLPPARWFSLLTEAKYDGIIVPGGHMDIRRRKKELKTENGCDVLTSEELKKNSMADLIAGRIMDEALINDEEDHHKIFKLITKSFKQYGNMFNAMFLPSPIKTLTITS